MNQYKMEDELNSVNSQTHNQIALKSSNILRSLNMFSSSILFNRKHIPETALILTATSSNQHAKLIISKLCFSCISDSGGWWAPGEIRADHSHLQSWMKAQRLLSFRGCWPCAQPLATLSMSKECL